jgi:hypothetical protein
MVSAGPIDTTERYRQQARHLRARYASRPIQLYRSLRQLSDRHDADTSNSCVLGPPLARDKSQDLIDSFGRLVLSQLEGRILQYSRRLELLKVAKQLGITRFHANLVIASVQHQFAEPAAGPFVTEPRRRWISTLLIILTTQSLVLFAAWEIFMR